MKKTLQFMLTVFIYSVLFTAVNIILPFSPSFKNMNTTSNPFSALYLFLNSLFVCYTIAYITHHASWRGAKRFWGISGVVFLIASFMTQIETLFFGDAFTALTMADTLLIMLAPYPSILAATLLGAKFFGDRIAAPLISPISVKALIVRIAILGLIYTAIYFIFGYFVAWRFEELRFFYSGSTEDIGLIEKLIQNFRDDPFIYLFQFIRGILFASMLLPLLFMLRNKKSIFIISVCLVYLTTAIVLIIPNPLFPDTVRWAHFFEMATSMLLFGIIAGHVLYSSFITSPISD